jgi:Mn2+/Fe2+ NRAMP family transporter
MMGFKPLPAILFAQATNGLLLPIIALFLLMVMNNKEALGEYRNSTLSNIAGGCVVATVIGLGSYKVLGLFF